MVSVKGYKVNRHSSLGHIWTDLIGNLRHEDQWRPREWGEGGRQRGDKHVSPALATASPVFARAARRGAGVL